MHQLSFFAYDTFCTISVELPAGCDPEQLLNGAKDIALAVEATLSMFDPTSELSRVCANYEPGMPCEISDILWTFLDTNLHLADLTDGAFDPTVGPLVKLWDFLSDDPKAPSPELLTQTLQKIGYRHITLDSNNKSVVFDITGIVIDPGASGKGFALGLVADYLQQCGVKTGSCNFGGNIFTIGAKRDDPSDSQRPWKVAILNPDDRQTILGTVELEDKGISTSSWYEHCFWNEGALFHHLIDPHTGMPKHLHLKSVSVISTNAFFTDLLSTAFFMVGERDGKALIQRIIEESGAAIEYVAVLEDGRVSASPGSGFFPYQ